VKPAIPEIESAFAEYDPMLGGQRIENMEMETSFLIHFLGALGYWAGSICTTINNRRTNTFDHHYQEAVKNSTRVALLALAVISSRNPDVRIS
jgi:uridine phosphorylase